MLKERYSINFQNINYIETKQEVSIFSETSMLEMEQGFCDCYTAFSGFSGFIYQKCKTREMERRYSSKRQVLDASVANYQKQLMIQFEEYAKRKQQESLLVEEKIRCEMKKNRLEAQNAVQTLKMNYEEYMQTSTIFKELLYTEQKYLKEIDEFINRIPEEINYKNTKEYMKLYDQQRMALEKISKYLEYLI